MPLNRSKVSITSDEPGFGELEAMLGEARSAFVDWARRALENVKAPASELGSEDYAKARDEVFAVFHDLKGAGGGVGMELMSEIGASGCAFLRAYEQPNEYAVKVAKAHIAAAEGVLAADIRGDGGEAGRALAAKLRAYAERLSH